MLSDPGQNSYYYYLLSKTKSAKFILVQSACLLNLKKLFLEIWGKDEIDYFTTALKLKCRNIVLSSVTVPRELSYIRLLMEYDGIFFS